MSPPGRRGQSMPLRKYESSLLHYNNPVFLELVAEKRKVEDEVAKDRIAAYDDLILSNGMKAERKIADKLDDDENNEM